MVDKKEPKEEKIFTKLPPREKVPIEVLEKLPSYIGEDKIGPIINSLRVREFNFIKTGLPLWAIEAVPIAMEAGLYPPLWALEAIKKGFIKYMKSKGGKTLDSIFGLDIGRGETPLLKREDNINRDGFLCWHVFLLIKIFGISVDEAATMVARRFEDSPEWIQHETDEKGASHPIGEETIKDKYLKEWKVFYEKVTKERPKLFTLLNMDDKAKGEFLKPFPEDSYPKTPKGNLKPSIKKFILSNR